MRIALKKPFKHKHLIVDLKLQDGTVVERIAIDATGEIGGIAVGGHDGIDSKPLPFRGEDIVAYRHRGGWAALFGLTTWHSVRAE